MIVIVFLSVSDNHRGALQEQAHERHRPEEVALDGRLLRGQDEEADDRTGIELRLG